MKVYVPDSLSGGFSNIGANVVPVGMDLVVEHVLGPLEKSLKRQELLTREIKIGLHVPLWNQEGVPTCNGVPITYGDAELVAIEHRARRNVTKGAAPAHDDPIITRTPAKAVSLSVDSSCFARALNILAIFT